MAPVATEPHHAEENGLNKNLKTKDADVIDPPDQQENVSSFNPFYSPPPIENGSGDDAYEYERYKPNFPKVDWPPLEPFEVVDRAHSADPKKAALLSAATKVLDLTPAIGTEIEGIDLRQLSEKQKDELALLVAERGVVFFRNQPIDIHQQLELARYYGPLHKHATTPVPKEPGLEEVHVVYNDSDRRPDPSAFSKLELWHSDVSYEVQPPSTTSLKGVTIAPVGGDTLWSSGYALLHVRRKEIESVHPVIRVHPVSGWKSVYVNPGFTRRIIGVPKAESDAILQFLFHQVSENPNFQVRFRWERDSIAIWDNRIVTHSATFDFWPHRRHALRATPHGERPLSVAQYEKQTGKEEGKGSPTGDLVGIGCSRPARKGMKPTATEQRWINEVAESGMEAR